MIKRIKNTFKRKSIIYYMTDLENEIINNIDLLKYYLIHKNGQKKYAQSEKGKLAIKQASQRYYEKKKQDPEFMENQRKKAAIKYLKKKDSLINLEFPDII